jgi:drug/metabolite transporter (DMT)-like permease
LLVAIPGLGGGRTDGSLAGIGFILLGALGVAIGNVLLKRLSVEVDLLVLTGWQFILGSLPLFISSFAMEAPRAIIGEGSFWLILAALALPGTALAFVIWAYLLRRNSLTRLNTFTFLTPVVALVIGAIGFSEKLSFVEGIGIAMTMAGAWWAARAKAIDHTPEARPSTTMSHHIQVEATAANTQHSKQVDMVRGEAKCIRAGDNQQAIHIDPHPPLASPYKLFHEVKRRSLFE